MNCIIHEFKFLHTLTDIIYLFYTLCTFKTQNATASFDPW